MYEAEGDVPVRLKVEKVGTLLEHCDSRHAGRVSMGSQ